MQNLYVATDVLGDWTYGMIVVAAPDVFSVRDVILAHTGTDASGGTYLHFDPDDDIDGTWTLQGQVTGEPRVIAFQYGGG
ncbi:MAG: hypothetical protein VW443_04780 [Pseudomonadales bacterium]|jgi:hypothetical protein